MSLFKRDNKTVEQHTADALNERGIKVEIAGKKFKLLPTTLSQVADVSAIVSTMKDVENIPTGTIKDSEIYAHVFKEGISARHKAEIAVVLLFRKEEERELNHDFIVENLTESEFKPIYEFMIKCIDPTFFLISTITLKGINLLTPTKTTPPLHSSAL